MKTDIVRDYKDIKGWGVDADPQDMPFYPMKQPSDNDNKGRHWIRPIQQEANVEILHSNERPGLSAVFGTLNPPRGLSGMIRRFAFKYSESRHAHWLPLLLADRIDMVEGIVDDLRKGRFPNILAEMGIKSEIKYNPKGLARKILIGSAIIGAFAFYRSCKNKD